VERSVTVRAGNLFADVSTASTKEEAFSEIFAGPGLKIERIISHGHGSPPEFWYDQAWNEWVIVLRGSATLQFEDEPTTRALGAGDYVFIPARKRHRVEWPEPHQMLIAVLMS
jgi:cupin 2 domain-containing protein